MAYENIKLRSPNLTMDGSYFYSFDQGYNSLVRKLDDGATAFYYPCSEDIVKDFVVDSFDGVTGTPLNAELWNFSSGLTITNNKVRMESVQNINGIDKMPIFGNFDIRIDFDIINGPTTNSWGAELGVRYKDGSRRMQMMRAYSGGSQRYTRAYWNGSSWTTSSVSTSHTSGKLRITRSGNSFTFFYWNGSAWVSIGSYSVDLTVVLFPYIAISRWGSNPSATVDFDNFF